MSEMKKPNQVYPSSARSTRPFMPPVIEDPSIRGASFDQLLQNRGIRFLHKRALPCPNMRVLEEGTHDPNCTVCDNKGFIYYEQKEIYGIFHSNSMETLYEMQGIWEEGQAIVTLPVEYSDGSQADFLMYDKLIVADFECRQWQMKMYDKYKDTKLHFDITNIDCVLSIENGAVTYWTKDTHFQVVDGNIHWIGDIRPNYNEDTGKGSVLSVSYFANPQFSVVQTMRELRATQEMVNGVKVAKRLPQEVLVKRDFLVKQPEKITD